MLGAILSSQSQPLRFFTDHLIDNNYGRGFSNIVLSERTGLDAKVRRRSKLQPAGAGWLPAVLLVRISVATIGRPRAREVIPAHR
jgi:hypothetical protein